MGPDGSITLFTRSAAGPYFEPLLFFAVPNNPSKFKAVCNIHFMLVFHGGPLAPLLAPELEANAALSVATASMNSQLHSLSGGLLHPEVECASWPW
jgi:hypothetical protein